MSGWQPGYVNRPWSTTLYANWRGLEQGRDTGTLGVYVDLMNEDGERQTVLAFGATVDEAVADAERRAGGTYTMNDWRAA